VSPVFFVEQGLLISIPFSINPVFLIAASTYSHSIYFSPKQVHRKTPQSTFHLPPINPSSYPKIKHRPTINPTPWR
jgi:hypothetical protein